MTTTTKAVQPSQKDKFVLLTSKSEYVVEYLLKQLILSNSITEALTFNDFYTAIGFKDMLLKECQIECSVNTYID